MSAAASPCMSVELAHQHLLGADADAALTRSQRVCDPTPTQRFTGRFHLV